MNDQVEKLLRDAGLVSTELIFPKNLKLKEKKKVHEYEIPTTFAEDTPSTVFKSNIGNITEKIEITVNEFLKIITQVLIYCTSFFVIVKALFYALRLKSK